MLRVNGQVSPTLQNFETSSPELAIPTTCSHEQEDSAILAFPGVNSPGYREVAAMAEEIAAGTGGKALICLEQDMAKALGQALALRLGPNAEILCIDRVKVSEGSYLDVGAPVGPALPVVVKTLVLGK